VASAPRANATSWQTRAASSKRKQTCMSKAQDVERFCRAANHAGRCELGFADSSTQSLLPELPAVAGGLRTAQFAAVQSAPDRVGALPPFPRQRFALCGDELELHAKLARRRASEAAEAMAAGKLTLAMLRSGAARNTNDPLQQVLPKCVDVAADRPHAQHAKSSRALRGSNSPRGSGWHHHSWLSGHRAGCLLLSTNAVPAVRPCHRRTMPCRCVLPANRWCRRRRRRRRWRSGRTTTPFLASPKRPTRATSSRCTQNRSLEQLVPSW